MPTTIVQVQAAEAEAVYRRRAWLGGCAAGKALLHGGGVRALVGHSVNHRWEDGNWYVGDVDSAVVGEASVHVHYADGERGPLLPASDVWHLVRAPPALPSLLKWCVRCAFQARVNVVQ